MESVGDGPEDGTVGAPSNHCPSLSVGAQDEQTVVEVEGNTEGMDGESREAALDRAKFDLAPDYIGQPFTWAPMLGTP